MFTELKCCFRSRNRQAEPEHSKESSIGFQHASGEERDTSNSLDGQGTDGDIHF